MEPHRRPPSPPCLDRGRRPTQRGGTLLAGDIRTLAEQQRALEKPDGCRPARCPTCGCERMHVHDYRERRPRGAPGWPPVVRVLRFSCARCDAVWRVLPAFLARHLWRVWTTVGTIVGGSDKRRHIVPSRTQRRWRERLATAGSKLVSVLAAAAGLTAELEDDASRLEVLDALGGARRLAELAVLVDRLAPGVRVM